MVNLLIYDRNDVPGAQIAVVERREGCPEQYVIGWGGHDRPHGAEDAIALELADLWDDALKIPISDELVAVLTMRARHCGTEGWEDFVLRLLRKEGLL